MDDADIRLANMRTCYKLIRYCICCHARVARLFFVCCAFFLSSFVDSRNLSLYFQMLTDPFGLTPKAQGRAPSLCSWWSTV